MLKLAAIQYKPPKALLPVAQSEICSLVRQAGEDGADLIVCPEMATTGYLWESPAHLLPYAEPAKGETFHLLSELAEKYETWIICGFPEASENKLFNSAWVIQPNGKLVCCYRKILLYDSDYSWSKSGQTRYLISSDLGTIFPAICMDLNDNNLLQALWKSNPDILAFCTNWLDEGSDVLEYWRHRILGWRGWFVAANSWGVEQNITFSGRSLILNPTGEVVAMAPKTGNCVIMADMG